VRGLSLECVEQVHRELTAEYGRWPSMRELVEVTGLTQVTIAKACRELGLIRTLDKRGRKPKERQ